MKTSGQSRARDWSYPGNQHGLVCRKQQAPDFSSAPRLNTARGWLRARNRTVSTDYESVVGPLHQPAIKEARRLLCVPAIVTSKSNYLWRSSIVPATQGVPPSQRRNLNLFITTDNAVAVRFRRVVFSFNRSLDTAPRNEETRQSRLGREATPACCSCRRRGTEP